MTILIVKLFFSYLLPWLVGFLLLRLLDREEQFPKGFTIFAALPIGIGICTLEVFIFGVFGANLSLALLLSVCVGSLAILGAAVRYLRRTVWPSASSSTTLFGSQKILLVCFCVVLCFKIVAAAWQVTHAPVYEFDAWNNWSLRGKVIFTEHKIPLDKTLPFYLGGGINSYPLNDGLWKVWVATFVGSWSDGVINLYSLVFYISLIGLFFFSMPRHWNFTFRLILTYALASLPFLYFHAFVAYADLEFTTYLFLSVISLFWFLHRANLGNLLLSAIALSLAVWTKNEGFAVAVPVFFIMTGFLFATKRLKLKQLGAFWSTALLVASPWLVFRWLNKLDLLSGNSSSFQIQYNSQFLGEWFSSIFLRSHFNFLGILLVMLLLLRYRQFWLDFRSRYLSLILILLFFVYNAVILFTDRALDLSALVRVNLHLAPIALYLTAVIFEPIFERLHVDKT